MQGDPQALEQATLELLVQLLALLSRGGAVEAALSEGALVHR
eukprot:SAG11_NODE_25237_length_361_cov_1.561069_2_plen_41_part_01